MIADTALVFVNIIPCAPSGRHVGMYLSTTQALAQARFGSMLTVVLPHAS